jgi:hypothetical protein
MAADTGAMFTSGQEEQAIRDAVRGIVDSFGPDYYQQQVDDGANCAERWDALGTKGYLGVHLPEKYGSGGLGLRELAIVVPETALGGCPLQAMLFSAGVTGTILNRTPVTSRSPGGCRAWPSAKHVCRSRLPSPMPARMPLGQTSSRHDHLFGRRPSRRRQSCISSSRSTAPERRALRGE